MACISDVVLLIFHPLGDSEGKGRHNLLPCDGVYSFTVVCTRMSTTLHQVITITCRYASFTSLPLVWCDILVIILLRIVFKLLL